MKTGAIKPAGDVVIPPPNVRSLQSLIRLRPPPGLEWCVLAYVLNRDLVKQDGSIDELYGMVFPLGSFRDIDKAEEHAKNVIAITGHPGVTVVHYSYPLRLVLKFDPTSVVEVAVDTKGKLMEMESEQYKRDREQYEKQQKIERDMFKEAEEETDPHSIEHFKRQVYLALKARSSFQYHTREADAAWETYKKNARCTSENTMPAIRNTKPNGSPISEKN